MPLALIPFALAKGISAKSNNVLITAMLKKYFKGMFSSQKPPKKEGRLVISKDKEQLMHEVKQGADRALRDYKKTLIYLGDK